MVLRKVSLGTYNDTTVGTSTTI